MKKTLNIKVVIDDTTRAAFAKYVGRGAGILMHDDEIRERLVDVITNYMQGTVEAPPVEDKS